MSVLKELLAAQLMEMTLRLVEENMSTAEAAVPQRALRILDGVQEILRDYDTNDFEKIEEIVTLFTKHGLSVGSCHDF